MTYERNLDLIECIKSICDSDLNNIDLKLFIFDNCTSDNPVNLIKNTIDGRIKYDIIRHKKNIGLIRNFWFASKYLSNLDFDFITYISDDDKIYYKYFQTIININSSGSKVVLSSCEILSDKSKKISKRLLPTRKDFKTKKLQALFDSRLITGFTITAKTLTKSMNAMDKIYPKNLDFWYPMTAICSFASHFEFIPSPQFIHKINNPTYWENRNDFKAFFVDRLIMYKILNEFRSINDEEYLLIIKDFILRQNIIRFFKLFFYKDLIIEKYELKIKIYILNVYFIFKIKNFIVRFYKFLYFSAKKRPIGIK